MNTRPPHSRRPRRRSARQAPSLAAALIFAFLAADGTTIASAQPATTADDPPVQTADQKFIEPLSADLLLRLTLERVRQLDSPTSPDYAVSAWSLRAIQGARPDDAELIRHEIDAWNAAGDRDAALDATRRLLRLDPDDTVAQFRLLTAAVERRQTADERLAAYQTVLEREDLADSIRSRAAVDGALLAREMGDDDLFIELLTEAATLDRTNKAAAALFATVFLDRVETPVERVEILANVVLADPLDPEAYTNLYTEFMNHGAYEQARRFLRRRLDALQATGSGRTGLDVIDLLHLDWQVEGVDAMLMRLAELQRSGDALYQEQRRRLLADDIDPGPEVAQLMAPRIELARLIALGSLGEDAAGKAFHKADPDIAIEEAVDSARLRAAQELSRWKLAVRRADDSDRDPGPQPPTPDQVEDAVRNAWEAPTTPPNLDFSTPDIAPLLRNAGVEQLPFATVRAYHRTLGAIEQRIEEIRNPVEGEATDPEAISAAVRSMQLERVWARLYVGADLELAQQELDAVVAAANQAGRPLSDTARERFRGWVLALRGDVDAAQSILEALTDDGPTARWALAMCAQYTGAERDAARQLLLLMRDEPESLLAAAARERAARLLGQAIGATNTANELNDYGRRFAPWLDRFTRNPRAALSLNLRLEPITSDALVHPRLTVQLRNTSPSPLAIGSGKTVSARVLLTPELIVGARRIPNDLASDFAEAVRQRTQVSVQQADQFAMQQVRGLAQRMLEVVDFNRRLRLDAQDQITVTLWPDRGFAGTWIAQDPLERTSVRWRATHGFAPRRQGGLTAGPYSVTAETRLLTRDGLPEISQQRPLDFSDPGRPRLFNVLRAVGRLNDLRAADNITAAADADAIREQLVAALPRFTPDEATYTLLRFIETGLLRPSDADDPLLRALTDAIGPDPNDLAIVAILLFAPGAHTDDFINLALDREPGPVRSIAEVVADARDRQQQQQIDPNGANDAATTPNQPDADQPTSISDLLNGK